MAFSTSYSQLYSYQIERYLSQGFSLEDAVQKTAVTYNLIYSIKGREVTIETDFVDLRFEFNTEGKCIASRIL